MLENCTTKVVKYNFHTLEQLITDNNISIANDYSNCNLTCSTIISIKCKCNKIISKTFTSLYNNKIFTCGDCSNNKVEINKDIPISPIIINTQKEDYISKLLFKPINSYKHKIKNINYYIEFIEDKYNENFYHLKCINNHITFQNNDRLGRLEESCYKCYPNNSTSKISIYDYFDVCKEIAIKYHQTLQLNVNGNVLNVNIFLK